MTKKLLYLSVCLIWVAYASAQTPNFDYPQLITNASGYVPPSNVYTIPCVGDWDSDGSLDLMVGVFFNGNIWYYHNSAPPGSPPVYDAYSMVYADGSPISVTYG